MNDVKSISPYLIPTAGKPLGCFQLLSNDIYAPPCYHAITREYLYILSTRDC